MKHTNSTAATTVKFPSTVKHGSLYRGKTQDSRKRLNQRTSITNLSQ